MRVRFSIQASKAQRVLLAGDFTNWEANARLMRRSSPRARTFTTTVSLPAGTYEYKFVVDGQWVADPKASSVPNCFGTDNSLLVVPK